MPIMLRVYIVDDEQDAIDGLVAMMQKKLSHLVELAGSNTSPSKAIIELENTPIDVLFLDVEMPEMSGIELLKHFPEKNFQVVFATAHEDYAIKAIKADASDYLVKPLSPQDVYEAVNKCISKKVAMTDANQKFRLSLSTAGKIILVSPEEIIRIEAESNYSIFHFVNKPKLMMSKTLKEFEEILSKHRFYRIHQSHLINLDHVSSILYTDGDVVVMSNGDKVEISRRKKQEFLGLVKGR